MRVLFFALVFAFAGKCPAQEFSLGADIDSAWKAGIDFMYRLEFDKAEEEFKKIPPENPACDLALAGLRWWQYSQNYDIPKQESETESAQFLFHANTAVDKAKKQLKQGGNDAAAYFVMGTAYGLIGRWNAVERHWWKAYTNGIKGRKYLKKAVELNPAACDAYAGLGIFDYYADTLPGVIKLPALLFVRGNRKRGLEEIDRSISCGKFFVTEAKLFKMSILVQFEGKYSEAVTMSRELRAAEPDNGFFWFIEIVTRFNSRDWPGTIEEASKFSDFYSKEAPPGIARQLALIYLALGDGYIMTGRCALAIDAFTKGIATQFPDKGWVTYCYLRRGQIYDILGDRTKALADYGIAASREDFWSTLSDSKRGLRSPYSPEEVRKQVESHD